MSADEPAASNLLFPLVLVRHLALCRASELLARGEPCLEYELDMYCDPVWLGYLNQYLDNHD